MTFSLNSIRNLLNSSVKQKEKLKKAYLLLPETRCNRKALCCSLLPEMTFIEALSAFSLLKEKPTKKRKQLLGKIIGYFFLNPVEIISCPFLDYPECLIYTDRFFGSRAYGLWSQEYYENLSCELGQCHYDFKTLYFHDLSFLIASLVFGFTNAVHMKFDLVREIVPQGIRNN